MAEPFGDLPHGQGRADEAKHKMVCEYDVMPFLETNLGISPRSVLCRVDPRRLRITNLELTRIVSLYTVAGRQRQIHQFRHFIAEFAARLPEGARGNDLVREMAGYKCLSRMHLVRLLAPRLDGEDQRII